jgi:hypothetical protein
VTLYGALMPVLKNAIEGLAQQFTAGILAAIRSASLEDLLADSGAASKRGPGRPAKVVTASPPAPAKKRGRGRPRKSASPAAAAATPKKRAKGGRLARRSPEDIEKVIGLITKALTGAGKGLRSEELQKALKLDKKEITGPLTQALAAKKISKKGEKRATTYSLK